VCNHPGGLEAVDLFAKIRFMRVGLGCDFVFLDHVSLCTAGREDNNRAQEIVSDGIIKVVQETGVGLVAVAQLRKADTRARAFEEGGAIALADFKGSASLVQAAKTVIGVERDQQGEDRNTASFRVLKNRHAGTTGPAGSVVYEPETARMIDRDVASLVGRMDPTVETIDMPPEQEGLTFLNGVDG